MRVHPSFDFNVHGSLMADFGGALNPDEGAQQWHAPVYSCSVSVYPFCPPRGASSLHLIMCPLAVPRLWVNQLEIMFSFSTAQKSSEERLVHEGQASSHNRISQRICRDFTSRKWKEEPKTEEYWKKKQNHSTGKWAEAEGKVFSFTDILSRIWTYLRIFNLIHNSCQLLYLRVKY